MTAGWVALKVEAIGQASIQILEVRVREETYTSTVASCSRWNVWVVGGRCPTRVLVHDRDRIAVAPIVVAAAQFHSPSRTGQSKTVVDKLLRIQWVHGSDVGLRVDVIRADVIGASLGEG